MSFLNRVIDPDVLRHRAPDGTRTQYLPVSGDGVIDREDPNDVESVDALDKRVDEINSATLDYSPTRLSSFCDDGCDKGCVDVPESVPDISSDDALSDVRKSFASITDTLANVQSTLTNYSGEMWVDRMTAIYSSAGFDIDGITTATADVYDKLTAAASASEDAGNEALAANRIAVQSLRNSLADRADHRVNSVDLLMMPLSMVSVPWMAFEAGTTLYSLWKSNAAENAGPEIIEAVKPTLLAAADTNDAAVQELIAALEAWEVTANAKAVSMPTTTKAKTDVPAEDKKDTDPRDDEKMPLVVPKTVTTGDTTPAAPTTTVPASNNKSIRDQLGDLLDKYQQQTPTNTTQPAAMPSMPDLGSMVPNFGEMIPDVSGLADAVEPMVSAAEEPLTEPMSEELPADAETEDDPEGVTEGDTAARTVQLDDRAVEFPNAELADVAQRMVDDPELSVLDAAEQAGYELPPEGEPLGESIPPSQVREGDIIATGNENGVYVGDGQVLMEGGEVVPLNDVVEFGDGQGIFRLAEPDAPVDGETPPVLV